MSRAVKTERQRFGGELTPKIIPLLPAFEAEKLLIEMHGPGGCFCCLYHHEIERPKKELRPDAMRFSSFSWLGLRNCGLQFRQQRRPAPQLSCESFDCAQSRSANMMLHSPLRRDR